MQIYTDMCCVVNDITSSKGHKSVSLPSPEDGSTCSFRSLAFSSFWINRKIKVQKPCPECYKVLSEPLGFILYLLECS
jgi:hypothetical protein